MWFWQLSYCLCLLLCLVILPSVCLDTYKHYVSFSFVFYETNQACNFMFNCRRCDGISACLKSCWEIHLKSNWVTESLDPVFRSSKCFGNILLHGGVPAGTLLVALLVLGVRKLQYWNPKSFHSCAKSLQFTVMWENTNRPPCFRVALKEERELFGPSLFAQFRAAVAAVAVCYWASEKELQSSKALQCSLCIFS